MKKQRRIFMKHKVGHDNSASIIQIVTLLYPMKIKEKTTFPAGSQLNAQHRHNLT